MEAEKTIVLNEVSDEQAGQLMQNGPKIITGLSKAVPKFTKIEDFTSFLAEYAMIGSDLVMHFYGTEEHPNDGGAEGEQYWKVHFPSCLELVGQDHFQATKPRLIAKYTKEMRSWFLKAQGYDHLTDIDEFVRKFCTKLDAALEGVKG
jgi:hypothetical protein